MCLKCSWLSWSISPTTDLMFLLGFQLLSTIADVSASSSHHMQKRIGPLDRNMNFCLSGCPSESKVLCCWRAEPHYGHVSSKTKLHSESPSPRSHPWNEPPADTSGQPAGSRRSSIRGIKRKELGCECLKMWIHAFLSFGDFYCVCFFCLFVLMREPSVLLLLPVVLILQICLNILLVL